jgi:hypothetical protein
MTKPSKPDVPTTQQALWDEFTKNKWAERLSKCSNERIDEVTEYESPLESRYEKRVNSSHFENGVHIAYTITYYFFEDPSYGHLKVKMLLVDDARHICQ